MSKENGTKGYLVGYCRVSTADQNAELQLDALTAAGCDRIFTDNASGKLEHRPALDTMMELLRPGDVVLIWRLDRLGRSVKHLLEMVAQLESRGVGLRSLCESIDTTTPTGRLTLHLFASIGQFERDLLLERTHTQSRDTAVVIRPSTRSGWADGRRTAVGSMGLPEGAGAVQNSAVKIRALTQVSTRRPPTSSIRLPLPSMGTTATPTDVSSRCAPLARAPARNLSRDFFGLADSCAAANSR
jgi:predicted site-specific integrase-resolvase